MTANQLAYLEYEERKRHNETSEGEMERANKARETLDTRKHLFEVDRYDNEAYLRNIEAVSKLARAGNDATKAMDTITDQPGKWVKLGTDIIDAIIPG